MAEIFGLADDGDEAAKATAALREELASLYETEGRALQRKRDLAVVQKRSDDADTLRLVQLRQQVDGWDRFARSARDAHATIRGLGGVFQDLFSGRLLSAAQGAFSVMGQMGGKGSAMAGVGAAGGAVVAAFQAVAQAGQTLFGTFMGFATSAAPGLGKTFSEVFEYLSASIGIHFLPHLVTLGAHLLTFAKTASDYAAMLANGVGDAVDYIMSIAKGARDLGIGIDKAVGWLGDAMVWISDTVTLGAFKPAEKDKAAEEPGRKRFQGFQAPKGVQEGMSMEKAMTMMLRSLVQNSGAGNPAFESGEAAYKRIILAEAGTTDIKRETLKLQREGNDLFIKMLEALEKKGEKKGEGGWSDWIPKAWGG